jgi:hypothetical protein
MRWLMIGFLVSLGALLFAAAGVAYHIVRHRAKHRSDGAAVGEATRETDLEIKH